MFVTYIVKLLDNKYAYSSHIIYIFCLRLRRHLFYNVDLKFFLYPKCF